MASVRVRTTVGASVVVGAALAVSSVALVAVLRDTMVDNVDTALRLRGEDVGAIVTSGSLPDAVAIEGNEDAFVQIVNRDGTVLAASANVRSEPEITDAQPGSFLDLHDTPIDAGTFRVYIHRTAGVDKPTVIVGRTLEDVDHTIEVVGVFMLIGGPLLTLLVAVTTWIVVGRALHPVERMRSEVDQIGEGELHRRVAPPNTDDEVGRLGRTMNEMLDRLESADERQKRFVSDASHELRTPIATVRHQLDVARADEQADLRAVVDDVAEENLRMQQLVDDLLVLAREDQSHHQAHVAIGRRQIVDLDDIVLVEVHRARPSPIPIDTADLFEVQVYGDEAQITRVVRNLIDNAVTYANSRVNVALSVSDGWAKLTVADDGFGVAPEDRERILERFARVDTARTRDAGGTGLGLAIADDLIRHHGGSLTVGESHKLGGARFDVRLPLATVS